MKLSSTPFTQSPNPVVHLSGSTVFLPLAFSICGTSKKPMWGHCMVVLAAAVVADSLASRTTSRCTRPDKSYLLRAKGYWRRVSLVVGL
jgi:hypothetical protein